MLLLSLLPVVAPLTPHLAEEVFLRLPRSLRAEAARHRSQRVSGLLGPTSQNVVETLRLRGPLTTVFQVRRNVVLTFCLGWRLSFFSMSHRGLSLAFSVF